MSQPTGIYCVQPGRTPSTLLLVCSLIGIAQAVTAAPAAADPSINARLPRENLLVYHGQDGSSRPVVTTDDWLQRRKEILAGMQLVMGRLPGPRSVARST